MKIAAFVVACLVATSAVSCAPTTRALTDDFDDFVGLLPLNDLLDLAMRYLLTDKEVQQTLLYLQGEEFSAVWDQFFELSAVRDLLQYLEEKMKSSTEFKALFEKMQNFDHKQLRALYESSTEVQNMIHKLESLGVDVDHIVEVLKDFFGWN